MPEFVRNWYIRQTVLSQSWAVRNRMRMMVQIGMILIALIFVMMTVQLIVEPPH